MANYSGPGAKRPKDANKPKRAQSAYFLFLADFRAKEKDNFKHEGGHKDLIKAGQYINDAYAGMKWPLPNTCYLKVFISESTVSHFCLPQSNFSV